MNPAAPFIYLDHSVMDALEKGRIKPNVVNILSRKGRVCYSTENLREMLGSPDYQESFCDVLKDLNALAMTVNLHAEDESSECTAIRKDPMVAMREVETNPHLHGPQSLDDSGMMSIAAKAYGLSDESFAQLFDLTGLAGGQFRGGYGSEFWSRANLLNFIYLQQ